MKLEHILKPVYSNQLKIVKNEKISHVFIDNGKYQYCILHTGQDC